MSFFPVTPLSAQTPSSGWATLRQEVDVDMSAGDGSATVAIRFELGAVDAVDPLPLGRPVSFELLGFGRAVVEEVRTGRGEVVVLWPTVGSHRAAVVTPAERDVDAGRVVLAVSYRVEDVLQEPGVSLHARIPLLTGPPVRAESGDDAFEARLTVPDGWVVTEGFPSGLRPSESGGYAVALRVVPSIVGFRARSDGAWRPGFPLFVDVVAVLILLIFAAYGWRHLRSVAA